MKAHMSSALENIHNEYQSCRDTPDQSCFLGLNRSIIVIFVIITEAKVKQWGRVNSPRALVCCLLVVACWIDLLEGTHVRLGLVSPAELNPVVIFQVISPPRHHRHRFHHCIFVVKHC